MSVETPNPAAPPATPAAAQVAAQAPPVASPTQTSTTPPAAQVAAEAAKTISVSAEEWATILKTREELGKIQAQQREQEAKAREEQIKAMTTKGEIENAFKALRDDSEKQLQAERARLAEIENRAKRYALDGELARALASQPLVPGAADQLTRLFRSEFVVEPAGDSFKVQSSIGFQAPAEFIAAQLARPEYAHFVRAQNPGGGTAGTTGAHQAAPTSPANPVQDTPPRSLDEAILRMAIAKKAVSAPGNLTPGWKIDGETAARQEIPGWGLRGAARQA
jgi:hypothetical protein